MLYNSISYDLADRASWVVGAGQYKYTASNERLLVHRTDGTNEVHMRGPGGELIGAYRIDWENGNGLYTLPVRLEQHERVHVAGRLLFEGGTFVATDRLGSVVYKCGSGAAVQNGGFESGVASWTSYGGAQSSAAAVPRTGSLSLRMTVTAANTGVYQDVTGLVPGMTYQFNAWVRSESGWTMAALTASNPDGSNLTSWGTQSISTNWQYQGACTKGTRLRYYPYGQEIGTVTANDTAKFGTYARDSGSGLDYAMNRYYMSTWGRFTTADPYRASGGPADPGSWNRYSYVQGDPVNQNDPSGLQASGPIYYCDPDYEGACVVRAYMPYEPASNSGGNTQTGSVAVKPIMPETKQECESRVKKEVAKRWQMWHRALGQRVWKAMKYGFVTGAFEGMIFGLGPELPSGWVGHLAGGIIAADAGAMKAMTWDELYMYLVESRGKDSAYNLDAQLQEQCGKLESPKP